MSDLDKVIHVASAARGAYSAFSEAVGEEGEVIREGRKISYKATGGFYRWDSPELYYRVIATDEQTGYEEKAKGENKDRAIEEAISKVLKKVTELMKSGSTEQDNSSNTAQGTQAPCEGPSNAATPKKSHPSKMCTLDRLIDFGSRALRHLGRIADSMSEWEGKIAEELDLTPVDVAAIKKKHPNELKLQARAALMQWKQSKGSGATYNNLIRVFEDAGYQECADAVRSIFTGQVDSGSISDEAVTSPSTGPEGASANFSVDQKSPSASVSTRLTFSEDMSDRDFMAYLKNEGVREKDYTSLIDNGVVAKAFLELTEDDIEDKQLNITFGGKKILKKLLKQFKKGDVTD